MWRGRRESSPAVFVTPAKSRHVSLVTGQVHWLISQVPHPQRAPVSTHSPLRLPETGLFSPMLSRYGPTLSLHTEEKTVSSRFHLLMLFSGTFPSESYHPHSRLSHTSLWQYSQAHKLATLHSVLHREATAALPEQNLESSSPVQNPSVPLVWLWLERGYLTHTHGAAVSLGIDKTEAHTQPGMRQHCCVLSNEG